jgi:hypothetical protein
MARNGIEPARSAGSTFSLIVHTSEDSISQLTEDAGDEDSVNDERDVAVSPRSTPAFSALQDTGVAQWAQSYPGHVYVGL